MKALYICDNKEDWALVSNLFKAHFSKVDLICALKAQTAMEYLNFEGPFAVILIDATMKDTPPSALGRALIDMAGERPLIFLGDKVSIKDRVDQDLYNDNDSNSVLYRPYDIEEFKSIIQTGLDWAQEEEFEQSVQEFDRDELISMKLRSFYHFNKIEYDVYLELTSTKFAKVLAAGKQYSHKTIQNYARKNVKVLFLKKDEYLRFLDDSLTYLIYNLKNPAPSLKKLISTQIKSVLILHQYLNAVGVTDSISELIQVLIKSTDDVHQQLRSLKKILALFPNVNLDYAEHAVLNMYCNHAIAMNMGWSSEMTRNKLGLASVLQDCTLSNENLLKINRLDDPYLEMFTEQEKKEFSEHPLKASQIATYFTGYSEVDYLIRQHHELPNGEGFPAQMNANKLTLLSCTFILSSQFAAKIVISKAKTNNLLQDIYFAFKLGYNTGNFKEPLMALEKAIKT
jgi:HD-GYP domain-containing protein (c-di-GMP phosphodiesterase class II)